MPFTEIFVVIGGQIDQCKACGMKIRKISTGGLQTKIRRLGKSSV
jgi:hypothetical protein